MSPIIILATSRTRSSMVAAIFKAHGVWVGDTFSTKAGYVSHENNHIKAFLKAHFGPLPDVTGEGFYYEPNRRVDIAAFCRKMMPQDRRWLFKGAVAYKKIFEPLDPVYVSVIRDVDGAVKSYIDKANKAKDPMAQEKRARQIIGNRLAVLAKLPNPVDTDAVIAGDYATIRAALEAAGIEPNDDKIREAIL